MIEKNNTNSAPSIKMPHVLNLEERKKLTLTGIKEVDGYDDKTVSAISSQGGIIIRGENLNIKKLSLDTGDLEIAGKIYAISYIDDVGDKKGFFSKIFK